MTMEFTQPLLHTDELDLAGLRAAVMGEVITPEDTGYDAARSGFNLNVNQFPAVILVAATAADVAEGVRFARANDLAIAVKATGHGTVLPANDALLIVTSRLNDVTVNADAQTARVEAGAKWAPVLAKAQEVGLAPLLGSTSDVGAIGYTLGGGMGWLARKYGMASDSVISFEVVTASGDVLRVADDENADLFWALRGGGAFAIVTAMTIRLFPVTMVYGGSLIYPMAMAKEVFRFYREWITYLPDEWTTSISLFHIPPLPELPPFLRGQSVVMISGVYTGDVRLGQMMAHTWTEWNAPIASTFQPMPFTHIDLVSNDPKDPTNGVVTSAWLRDLSDATVDKLLEWVAPEGQPGPIMKLDVRYAGGAIARVAAESSAYGHRSETLIMEAISITPTPAIRQLAEAYQADFKRALAPHMSGGVYLNLMDGQEVHAVTHKQYSAAQYARLVEIKAKYDPENIFRFGRNFIPANR